MTGVLAGLRARQQAAEMALKQALAAQKRDREMAAEGDQDGRLWRLQQQLNNLNAQIDAYERVESRAR